MVKKKKFLIVILILLMLFNISNPLCSFATGDSISEDEDPNKEILDSSQTNGILAYASYPFKFVVLLFGLIPQGIMTLVANAYRTASSTKWLTIDNILFNQLSLTDINIFSQSVFLIGTGGNIQEEALKTGALLNIRKSIAQWYFAFRNLALVIALLMLVYIGIRMAINTFAEQKAKYKSMLSDWLVRF